MKTLFSVLLVGALVSVPAFAESSLETIGHIQKMDGAVFIQRGDHSLPSTTGAALYRGDLIHTGKPGAVGIVLTDDTTVSLGSNSELSLDDYAFDPKDGKFGLAIRMIKGTFAYLTGQIGKLAPDTARLHTPDATIATRGTKLLIQIKE